jgi:hypothetical protein
VEILRQIARQFELGWTLLGSCLSGSLSAPACKSVWTWATVAAIAVGLLVFWKILAWLLRPLRFWLADRRMRAREREVADPDTMARFKVDDTKLYSPPGEDNVAQQIREALDRKKIDEQQRRHHQTLGNKKV